LSHHVLQRVVVRLLFDPEFVERVYADPDLALQGLDLSADERRLVVAPDRRAYGTDATRRSRALTELVRGFPTASAVAVQGDGIAFLEGFFASPIFHAVIQERGSLAAGYGAFLEQAAMSGALRDPRAAALARLEGAVARIRRAPRGEAAAGGEAVACGEAAAGDGATDSNDPATAATDAAASAATSTAASAAALNQRLVLTPHATLVTVPAGTFDLLAAITRAIATDGRDPVAQVLEPGKALHRVLKSRGGTARSGTSAAARAAAIAGGPAEHLLVEAPLGLDPEADARVSPVTPELAGLLRAAAPPGAELHTLMATAQALGAEAGGEEALILDLVHQGLLVAADS
jgi:hypothetical protein